MYFSGGDIVGMKSTPTIERSDQFNYGTVIVPPLSKKEVEYEEATRRLLGPGTPMRVIQHHDMHLMSYLDRHNYATMRMYSLFLLSNLLTYSFSA